MTDQFVNAAIIIVLLLLVSGSWVYLRVTGIWREEDKDDQDR